MTSPRTNLHPNDLKKQLSRLGFHAMASELDDFLAHAIRKRWDPRTLVEQIVCREATEKARRSLERRLRNARIGRFKPMADFDWNWPTKIDRPLIERALTLDFIPEARNLILLGANGLGKTMITQNIAHEAVLAGHSVLFRTASDLLDDLQSDSPLLLRKRLKKYARPALLCIDEIGYLSYDTHAADLLYEVVSRRYEERSIILTTNRSFKDWNIVFPNATSIVSLLDRLTHHADLTVIEGQSYRRRESELEAARRRRPNKEQE